MDYYLGIGIKNIESRILYLVNLLIDGLENHGYEVISCKQPEKRSGIVYFAAPDPTQLVQKLRDDGIIVALRNGKIRLSPHFYCNEDDIEKFLHVLEIQR